MRRGKPMDRQCLKEDAWSSREPSASSMLTSSARTKACQMSAVDLAGSARFQEAAFFIPTGVCLSGNARRQLSLGGFFETSTKN